MTALRKTQVDPTSKAAPFAIRAERAADVTTREALLDACFGENRHGRTCQRLRDGRAPAAGLALAAMREGKLVGTVRLWHVSAGGRPALVLGPLAGDPACREPGARPRGGRARSVPRTAGGGPCLPRARDRRCADATSAGCRPGARPCRRDPARGCPLLRPLRLPP